MSNTLYWWRFKSSSSPDKIYTTLQIKGAAPGLTQQYPGKPQVYPELTCNCPGWTRRTERICVHTRVVLSGAPERDPLFVDSTGRLENRFPVAPYPTQTYATPRPSEEGIEMLERLEQLYKQQQKRKKPEPPKPEPQKTTTRRFNFDE